MLAQTTKPSKLITINGETKIFHDKTKFKYLEAETSSFFGKPVMSNDVLLQYTGGKNVLLGKTQVKPCFVIVNM